MLNRCPSFDNIYVKVSNKEGAAFNDFGNDTYFMKFDKAGGGLNSLHITTNPRNPDGNVTITSNLTRYVLCGFYRWPRKG